MHWLYSVSSLCSIQSYRIQKIYLNDETAKYNAVKRKKKKSVHEIGKPHKIKIENYVLPEETSRKPSRERRVHIYSKEHIHYSFIVELYVCEPISRFRRQNKGKNSIIEAIELPSKRR